MKRIPQEFWWSLTIVAGISNFFGFIIGAGDATSFARYCPNEKCVEENRERETRGCVYERVIQVTNIGYVVACELWRPRWRK